MCSTAFLIGGGREFVTTEKKNASMDVQMRSFLKDPDDVTS